MYMHMRDIIDLWESSLIKEKEVVKAVDAEKNHAIKYYDRDQYSDKERVDRLSISPTGKAMNPVDQSTVGKDTDTFASPNFTGGEKLEALHKIKVSLEILERLHHGAEMGLNKENPEDIRKMISDMHKQLDEISDSLVEDY